MFTWKVIGCFTICALGVAANPVFEPLRTRQSSNDTVRVDLGYAIYEGVTNASLGVDVYKGIRFAAPPIGKLRWQAPKDPETQPGVVQSAADFGFRCPQSDLAGNPLPNITAEANEDCLFLNIWTPSKAKNLPVFVWIHGGGYGVADGRADMANWVSSNGNNHLAVWIQYRLGAFGFLSSEEVARYGTVNAGLLDQRFALQWVQKYIERFGGDPTRVTVGGGSAGGGSVMLQSMAYGDALENNLYQNAFAASPYLPAQNLYNDTTPERNYQSFATQAGCATSQSGNESQSTFECLVNADTVTLQKASANVSASGVFGTWQFVPVTDTKFIREIPSQQLLEKRVRGKRLLTGNNANEGFFFTIQTIKTVDDLKAWLKLSYPKFNDDDIQMVLDAYPASDAPVDPNAPLFATNGVSPPTVIIQGPSATGQQERAVAILSESVFVCPSYWLAEAFSGDGREGYKYQYSLPPAFHAQDFGALFGGPPGNFESPDFIKAYQTMLVNFITKDNPSIPSDIANGASSNSTTPNAAASWPVFQQGSKLRMINFNQTEPGTTGTNDISLADADAWEGGRGARCEFWRKIGPKVPE